MRHFLPALTYIIAFVFSAASAQAQTADTTQANLSDKINALYTEITEQGKLTGQLSDADLANLPIGIVKEVGGIPQIIMVDNARFTAKGAFFDVYVSLELPFMSKRVAFSAENIAFQPGGIAASTSTKLLLVTEEKISISPKVELILPAADKKNFVEWDCNGFKALNLKGRFEFSRDMLIPEKPNGDPDPVNKVAATFEINTNDPGSIITTVNFSPFQVPKLKGMSFAVKNAVVDYSDIANFAGMKFPEDYTSSFDVASKLWTGFYMQSATIRLPEELGTKSGRKSIDIQNLIIDNQGFSGSFGVANIFGTNEGTMNGWPFSIDSLGVTVVKDQLKGAAFRGMLKLPMLDAPMKYGALIIDEGGETNYIFSVTTTDTYKLPALIAEVEIAPGSVIKVEKKDGKLQPEAILHGYASIKGGNKISVKRLKFEKLHLASSKPYVREGVWSLESDEQSVSSFPVTISNVGFRHKNDEVALKFDVGLNLMNKEDKGFGANTTVELIAGIEEEIIQNGETTVTETAWKYKRTKVDDILIDFKSNAFELAGILSLYDEDPIYGNGFRGQINAKFAAGPELQAVAQFGKIQDLRYWYVDAKVRLPQGMGVPIGFYGFGGGLYYHMSMEQFAVDMDAAADPTAETKTGKSKSGIVYVPNPEVSIGFKATVIIGTSPNARPFNADATFEMAFNNGGGIRYIAFRGQGYFMTPIDQRSAEAPIYVDLLMTYDNMNKVFHATLDTYINVAGGAIKGIHEGGLAGTAVLHFAPDEWYIYVGTPEQRIGVSFIGLVKTGSYFMVGTKIPGMPPPPDEVSEILGDMDLDFMRDENALGTGAGFAFGASLQVNTGKLQVLMFYGEFKAGLGFDIMLKDYGNASCVGANGPIGINGWYASGQAWAYLQGVIGIRVNLKFIKGEFEILKIGAAAVLQAKLPNPFYMRGIVGGEFAILGGLVKGKCRFKVTIGEECEIEGVSSTTGVKVIAKVTPQKGENEVGVFTAPQAVFNLALDKKYEMLNNEDEFKAYRVKLDKFKLMDGSTEVAGEIIWNDNKDVAVFKPHEILPPKKKLNVVVKILWEEYENGVWRKLGGSNQEYEEETTEFVTGEAPKNIPEENVVYSYPVKGQYNFLKEEYPEGYIKLDFGQEYLFKKTDDSGISWNYIARFETPGQPVGVDVPLKYNTSNAALHFEIPKDLQNEKPYQLHILKLPAQAAGLDDNVMDATKQVYSQDSTEVNVADRSVEGTLALPEDFRLYKTHFRTSKYNTFMAKLNSTSSHRSLGVIIEGWNVLKLGYSFETDEVLDKADIHGWKDAAPLIQMQVQQDNRWFSSFANPVIYSNYPINSDITISNWREEEPAGVPPVKSMVIYQRDEDFELSSDATVAFSVPGTTWFNYDLEYYGLMDFSELKNKAWNRYTNRYSSAPQAAKTLMNASFINLYPGQNYNFKIYYVLPGINKVTTQKIFTIKN